MFDKINYMEFYSKRIKNNVGIPSSEYSSSSNVKNKWVIPLNYGMPSEELFNLEEVTIATAKALKNGNKKILQYGGGEGVKKLVNWILKKYSNLWDINCKEDDVLITYGASQAIDLIARTFINEGDEIWLEAPTYFGALYIFSSYKAKLKDFPVDSEGVNVDLIEEELLNRLAHGMKMPKLLYTIPTFQNPTGTTLSLKRRKKLGELAKKFNFIIIEDDSYGELNFTKNINLPIKSFGFERTIYISTFSKVISPGFRLGWIIAHKNIIQELKKMKPDGGTSGLTQEIMATLLENIDYEDHIKSLQINYSKKKDIMESSLKSYFPQSANWISPNGGFYIWIALPEHINTNEILNVALNKRVNFVPGTNFYINSKGTNELRLSYSYCSEASIEVGIKRLGEVLKSKI